MPVVRESHPLHERLMKSGIHYIGAEVIFTSEEAEVASTEFIQKMHLTKNIWQAQQRF